MPKPTLADKLVVAISSRALFDLAESHHVYTEQGVAAYHRYQVEHENDLLAPGPAFALAKKLLNLNRADKQYVEVILLSRNSADTGLRVFNAIKHYELDITRAAFTKGEPTSRYVPAFGAHLFLSADPGDVKRALADGYAAATIVAGAVEKAETTGLRLAFDGDAVIFSDEAERVYQERGLVAFARSEVDAANKPLSGGPFKEFLAALHRIQADFPEDKSPIRTALVTARSAPAHERVIARCAPGTSGSTRRSSWAGSTRATCCAPSAPTSSSTTSRRMSSRPRATARPATCRTASPMSADRGRCRCHPGCPPPQGARDRNPL